ncbi:MAG: hypothetical protein WCJ93_11810 [Methanomicrobiales archaeon]
MYPLFSRLISVFRSFFGLSDNSPGEVAIVVQEPALPNWKTETVHAESFVKVGRIAMCGDGLEIHSDLDSRVFILLNEDIDAVLDGDKRDIRFLDARDLAGSARLSASGRALNIVIGSIYYTVPLRSVLAVLDGRNRKGAIFVGK